MSSRAWHSDDDALLSEVSDAIAAESVPDRVRQAGYAAFAWRDVDLELELLTLVYDSVVQSPAGLRSEEPQGARVLVFESGDLTLEVEVGVDTIMGRVVPAGPERVVLETHGGEVHDTETDDGGFFLLRHPASSPVRIKIMGDVNPLVTDWFAI